MLTVERLKELLSYDPETGIFRWLKKPSRKSNRVRVGEQAGCFGRVYGNILIGIDRKIYGAHRLAWLYMHGYMPAEIDHANGNAADNRLANLRECTHAQNMKNIKRNVRNTSGFKGVSFDKPNGTWRVRITSDSKSVSLGSYATKEEAHAAYREGALRYHGDFARFE